MCPTPFPSPTRYYTRVYFKSEQGLGKVPLSRDFMCNTKRVVTMGRNSLSSTRKDDGHGVHTVSNNNTHLSTTSEDSYKSGHRKETSVLGKLRISFMDTLLPSPGHFS